MKPTISRLVPCLCCVGLTSSFTMESASSAKRSILSMSMVSREEYLRPHFEARPVKPQLDFDCAESNGICELEEMNQMMQDLEKIESDCSDINARECDTKKQMKREMIMSKLGDQMELSFALNSTQSQGSSVTQLDQDNMVYHLQRLHEIAKFEEH